MKTFHKNYFRIYGFCKNCSQKCKTAQRKLKVNICLNFFLNLSSTFEKGTIFDNNLMT